LSSQAKGSWDRRGRAAGSGRYGRAGSGLVVIEDRGLHVGRVNVAPLTIHERHHQGLMNGIIKKVVPDRGFGFIAGEDDTDYFLHRDELRDLSYFRVVPDFHIYNNGQRHSL
jgi:hypothetical protein